MRKNELIRKSLGGGINTVTISRNKTSDAVNKILPARSKKNMFEALNNLNNPNTKIEDPYDIDEIDKLLDEE